VKFSNTFGPLNSDKQAEDPKLDGNTLDCIWQEYSLQMKPKVRQSGMKCWWRTITERSRRRVSSCLEK
jgi:hypothetical protein